MVLWVQSGCHYTGCLPLGSHGWIGALAAAAQYHENVSSYITSLGKDQNPKSEVWFPQYVTAFTPL